jgi:flavin reductase (DIM6/NTAB) family NADH-FMN oxidoreductase RutF
MNKIDLAGLAKEDVFKLIGSYWMLVCAGKKARFNMMTASWGGIGWLWNKPVAFVFVRPERYTHGFVEAEERLSLSFFTEEWREALKFCGSKSGRDFDKCKETGLSAVELESGAVAFNEARLVLDCRKLFKASMDKANFVDKDILAKWYNDNPGGSLHDVYVVEIESVFSSGSPSVAE